MATFGMIRAEDCDEPETWGGASCETASDCNGNGQNADNYCNRSTVDNVTRSYCVCDYKWAGSDCSYSRYNKDLAGGLEFLAFAGVGGIGNFIADRTGNAVGQMILMFAPFLICCVACCAFCGDEGAAVVICIQVVLAILALAGFIWCMVDAGLLLGGGVPDGSGYYPYDADCTFVPGY